MTQNELSNLKSTLDFLSILSLIIYIYIYIYRERERERDYSEDNI